MVAMKRAFGFALIGCFALIFTFNSLPLSGQQRYTASARADSLIDLSDRLEAICGKILPSVVSVEAVARPTKPGDRTAKETGSGVIIKLDGRPEYFIVTNYHVVKESTLPGITVILKEGRILRPTYLFADRETDLAFMTVDGAGDLQAAPLGNSDNAKVGRLVLAMGNPFGHGWSVSHGIISARERGQVILNNQTRVKDFLQTDAAINPGSSGGPLVDMNGEVIGISTCIASLSKSNSGVGFCIPSNLIKSILSQLLERGNMQRGHIQRGYLGAQLAEAIDPMEAVRLGRNDINGALVEKVIPNSPADIAGLRPQDIILALDKTAIRSESQFINLVSGMAPGQVIRLQVWRNRTPFTLEARIDKAPREP
jgi:S1-C subfamily serine protease